MNPLTATLSILFVVALYSVRKTDCSEECEVLKAMVEKDRQTRGESSLSTRKACSATDANRAVGRGKSIVLCFGSALGFATRGRVRGRKGVVVQRTGEVGIRLGGHDACSVYYYDIKLFVW